MVRSEGLCNRIVSEVSKRLKDPLLGPFLGPIKWGHFTPPLFGGSEKGSKVEVLMVFKIYRYQIWLWFSWCGVKACATNCFSGLKESKKEPFLGPTWGPIKWGHFTPPFGGSEIGSNLRI